MREHNQNDQSGGKSSRHQVRDSQKQVKQLIDSSPVAIVISFGIDERVESVNDKFIDLFGFTIEDMPDVAHWWPLAYPDEEYREKIKTQWKKNIKQAIREKGQIEPMEATVTCKDGSLRYVEFRLSSIDQKHIVTFVDLTERKRAEDALRERERHSQSLLRLSRSLECAQTYTEVLNAAHDEVKAIVGYQNLWVYLLTDDKKYFKALIAGGPVENIVMRDEETATLTIKGDRMLEEIAEAKEIVVVEDARIDDRTDKVIVARLGNRTIVNIPIILFDRHLGSIGTGTFGDEGVRPPTNSEREYLSALASHMAVTLDRIHLLIERKQAEQALRESEHRFRTIVDLSPDAIVIHRGGKVHFANQACLQMLGFDNLTAVVGKNVLDFVHPDYHQLVIQRVKIMFEEEKRVPLLEEKFLRADGSTIDVEVAASQIIWEGLPAIQVAFRDITERKLAEQEHLAHLRFLQSMDQVNRAMQGIHNLEQMMSDVLDVVLSVFACDRAWLFYPADPEAASWRVPMERTRPEFPGVFTLGLDVPMNPDAAKTIKTLLSYNGPVRFGPGSDYPLPEETAKRFNIQSQIAMTIYPKIDKPYIFGLHQCSYPRVWTLEDERLFQEIGRRLTDSLTSLLTYRNLQESEEHYRGLVELSPDSIGIYSKGKIIFVNSATVRMSGAKSEEDLIGRPLLDLIHPDSRKAAKKRIDKMLASNKPIPFVEEKFLRLNGSSFDVEVAAIPYYSQGVQYVQIVARDITERKHHEREREAIIIVSNALRLATTRAEILNVILDQLVDLFDADGAMLVLPNPHTGDFINEMGRGAVAEKMIGLNIPPGEGISNWVITNKKPYLNNHADHDPLFYRADLLGDSHCVVSTPLIAKEQAIGALWIARQINFVEQDLRLLNAIANIAANAIHRVMLHEQTEQQLHHLIALHQIDIAISTNFDLSITLNVILNNVKTELEVDAASILLLNPVSHTLDYAAGIGFRTRNIEQSHVKLGDGYTGRAALEYRTVSCPDLRLMRGSFSRSSLLAGEEFAAHYVTPLIVKGQVKGVLELFHRNTFEPEPEWLSYFETIATQSAIAIESASLFENLQSSNMELMLAYDATIEGWSRALDLRDRETEGHTQRVTDMALRLAEKMGMSDAEKQDLWRGALLHDIGKMGVPDSILLKPGLLTESEWEVMRQHPSYAYQMLSPITYLKHALDIPYCHHEKWDGSGYPRGLKGEEIPLSARVFAVVDVFDALTSDRPYRKAWPRKKVDGYIQEQAGKHFDPQVVKIFFETRS